MKNLKNLWRKQKGFTLIELMIVVGIIGILVAIAAPNFAKYQSKARQAEAKIALAAVYTGEKSFYSEYTAYIPSMDAMGYYPEGNKRFYTIGWNFASYSGTVQGYAGGVANTSIARSNFPAGFGDCTVSLGQSPANNADDPQAFTVTASGQLRDGLAICDGWTIDDAKVLSNPTVGL
ncbi:MAG: prepilin-type N-terminal cleavage/methylation domain-containing protein [Bdellovibrionales bacterium]|nr:prepilin-type N-terminal cleavage/methylation domain-containing protein [Bdellovibrionales bacterium]